MHSEKYIDKTRLEWWDQLWINHIGELHGFAHAKRVCDLGAGAGHWAQTLSQALPWRNTEVVALDSDPGWVTALKNNRELTSSVRRLQAIQGNALDTQLPDDGFDMVTCQTLALHVDNPKALLTEMIRIAEPGGIIVMAEPANIINRCQLGASIKGLLPSEAGLMVTVWMAYHRGVLAEQGLDYDVAISLPSIISSCGISSSNVYCYKNPKVVSVRKGFDLSPEYNDENFRFAKVGGINREQWNQAALLTKTLAEESNEDVFMDALFLYCIRI